MVTVVLALTLSLSTVGTMTALAHVFAPVGKFNHATNVSGQGLGLFKCPNGVVAGPGNPITFTASEKGRVVTGTWNLAGGEVGIFSSGKISKDAYTLNGVQNQDNVCGASLPSRITIYGHLGQGVTINFVATNGITGTFTGNVVSY
jgi:hypothetical protein